MSSSFDEISGLVSLGGMAADMYLLLSGFSSCCRFKVLLMLLLCRCQYLIGLLEISTYFYGKSIEMWCCRQQLLDEFCSMSTSLFGV